MSGVPCKHRGESASGYVAAFLAACYSCGQPSQGVPQANIVAGNKHYLHPSPPPPTFPAAEDGKDGASAGASSTAAAGAQQRMSDYVLPACDSKALCAYLGLFRCGRAGAGLWAVAAGFGSAYVLHVSVRC